MHGDELASPQIPMRLLRHQSEIDCVGHACVQKRGDGGLGVGCQIVAGFVKRHRATPNNYEPRRPSRLVGRGRN